MLSHFRVLGLFGFLLVLSCFLVLGFWWSFKGLGNVLNDFEKKGV